MLKWPIDIPCRTCGRAAGEWCVYTLYQHKRGGKMPGYHSSRKYDDLPFAKAAERALLGDSQ